MTRRHSSIGHAIALAACALLATTTPARTTPAQELSTVKEQRLLLRRAERLSKLMKQLEQRYKAEGRTYFVGLLREGLEHLEQSGVLKNMNEASIALEKALTSKALRAQTETIQHLEKLLGILMDRRTVEDLDADAKRVAEQLNDLKKLSDRERKVRERMQALREESRTEEERRLVRELTELASRQRVQARDNASRSDPLQDELEHALRQVKALQKSQTQLRGKLERDKTDASQRRSVLDKLQDLVRGTEANLERLRAQKQLEDTARNVDRLAKRNDRDGLDPQEQRDAATALAEAARRLRANPKQEGDRSTDLARALDKTAEQLAAAKDRDAAQEPLDAALAALDERMKQLAARASSQSENMARGARDLATKLDEKAKEAQAGDKQTAVGQEAARQKQLDKESAQDLSKAAKNLESAQKALAKSDNKEDSRAAADRGTEAALRHLQQAEALQRARERTAEAVARDIADRARRAAADLNDAAGSDKTGNEAAEKMAAAGQAMQKAAEAMARNRADDKQEASPNEAREAAAKAQRETQDDRDSARESLAQAEKTLSKEVARRRAASKARTGSAVARQERLQNEAKQVAEQAQRAAQRGQITPEQNAAAKRSLDGAQKAMQRAKEQLAKGSPRAAARQQADAANKLDETARKMQDARKLGREQQKALADLARRQEELARDILELARRVDRKKNREARQSMQEAQSAAEDAAERMNEGEENRAEDAAKEAERKLDEAREQLEKERDRYMRLRQEELLFRIAEEVQLLVEKQDGIGQRTSQLAESLGDKERVPRRLRSRLKNLGQQEGELAARARFLAEHLQKEGSLVFTYVLQAVAEDLDELQNNMSARRPSVGADMLGQQDEVLTRLNTLLGALRAEVKRKRSDRNNDQKPGEQRDQQEPPKNTNEGDRKRKLVPDVAELQLLKRLEIDSRERISGFLRLNEEIPEGMEQAAQRSLRRLAFRHAKISDLLSEFLETRGIGQAKEGEKKDASKNDPGKNDPGKKDNGKKEGK
ncbi:MAG: hypothetical protein CMJ85_05110 [Planctomycetes bacterium]|nr:hypothetical protein [Planctomycetota bacterium]